jgi:chitin disaccharide deacetylase
VKQSLELIVNVDDLGLHPAVRRAIEEGAAHGTVTSASVLANGPDLDAVRPLPGVSLGAHLNILRGPPLSPRSEIRSLVGDDGNFLGSAAKLALRVLRGAVRREEVRLEWSRQVAALRERGLALSHVDGEKHTHCLPGLFAVACEVAEEHGIRWVRRSDERFGNIRFGAPAVRRALLRALCVSARTGTRTESTDAVWGIAEQGAAFTAAACERALAGIGARRVEVVCHPGLRADGDPALPPSFGRMRVHELWEPEHRSLCDGSWRETAARNRWKLVNFETVSTDAR